MLNSLDIYGLRINLTTYVKFIFICSHLIGCQALARLRFSETVAQSDVDEALRLMQMSKFSLYSDDRQRSGLDAISDIYSILRDEAARSNRMDVSYAHALNWISRKVCRARLWMKVESLLVFCFPGGKNHPAILFSGENGYFCHLLGDWLLCSTFDLLHRMRKI